MQQSWRPFLTRVGLFHLTSGRTIRGVLWARRGPLLVLRGATLLDNGQEVPLDGEVLIERAQVDWAQVF